MSTSRDLWQAYMTYVYTYLKPHDYTGIIKKEQLDFSRLFCNMLINSFFKYKILIYLTFRYMAIFCGYKSWDLVKEMFFLARVCSAKFPAKKYKRFCTRTVQI